MIQMSGNPVDVISAVVFFLFFLSIGIVLLLRPQLGVRLMAQSLQRYQRFYKLSDEQLERTPKLFFRSIAGDSIVEFAHNGAKHPESYPKAMLYIRIAGAVIVGFMLVPACLVLLLISVFGVSFVSTSLQQPLTLACLPVAIFFVIRTGPIIQSLSDPKLSLDYAAKYLRFLANYRDYGDNYALWLSDYNRGLSNWDTTTEYGRRIDIYRKNIEHMLNWQEPASFLCVGTIGCARIYDMVYYGVLP